ncbi:MAG: hypothetical protein AAF561_13135 [Planctomycetota bacterium]
MRIVLPFPAALISAAVALCGCDSGAVSMDAEPTSAVHTATDTDVTPSVKRTDKLVLMHYMPWHRTPEEFGGRGGWGGHWTGWGRHDPEQIDDTGRRDVYSHFYPLIDVYDSADPHVVEAQLLQMRLAGVDGVIVDWYGIGQAADYPENQVGTQVLFEQCEKLGIDFAVCYEDRTVEVLVNEGHVESEAIGEHLAETLVWLQENWFASPVYVHLDDRPLFLNFGPIYVSSSDVWEVGLSAVSPRPMFIPLQHLWRGVDADGGFAWVHQRAWDNDPPVDVVKQRLLDLFADMAEGGEFVPSAVTGFKDIYDVPFESLDHRDGDTLRASLEAALAAPGRVVQLVTWNDYGEGTMIEPTREFDHLFLEILQDRLLDGGAHDDLRLPARLLDLRRAGNVASSELDAIAQMLSDRNVAGARAALDRLDTD